VVRSLAAEGAIVICVNRPGPQGPALEQELTKKGQKIKFVPAELTDIGSCRMIVENTIKEYGRIDVLVNNAGFNNQLGLEETPPDKFMEGVRDNLIHVYALSHYACPYLIKSKGNIVNIGSHVSITGQGKTSAYVAAKGAICGLTREWAAFFADKDVRVNCIVPGSVWTNAYVKWAAMFENSEERRHMAEQNIPLGRRMTTVEEFADLVVFVTSGRATHLTGEIIVCDGGYTRLDRVLT
jgi:L-fucose dehydrogenase